MQQLSLFDDTSPEFRATRPAVSKIEGRAITNPLKQGTGVLAASE